MIKLMDILLEKREYVRNNSGKVIGNITTETNGKQTFRDNSGKFLGIYDPKYNYTKDYTGKVVGKGNILGYLIKAYR
jgi:hypothetical protein